MKHTLKKPLSLGLAALALAAAPAALQAQEIFIVGNAQGCFGLLCAPGEADAIVLSGVSLTYTSSAPSDFEGTTVGGQLAVNETGTSTTGTFGSISVGTAVARTAISTPFTLLLQFFNPVTADQVFDAVISGIVRVLGTGGITVDYDESSALPSDINETTAWQPFFDPLTGYNGFLRTTAAGTFIPSGGTGDLNGLIEANAVPEPASLLLLGTGLAGLVAVRRRRRKQQDVLVA